jgi:ribosomal protein L11 methyltransferase
MPYRVDIYRPPAGTLDVLVELGALDVENTANGVAAILPDVVTSIAVASALGVSKLDVSTAVARDNGSVWLLTPQAVSVGGVVICPAAANSPANALRLIDANAFGTGHHPTTALCIEAIAEIVSVERVESVLDVGTGSGILALAALMMGVPRAAGVDVDADALRIAAENARLNQFEDRLQLVLGGANAVDGRWPLVVANLLAAPLIDMAPVLVRRLATRGRLILSGIAESLESEVRRAYQHHGVWHVDSKTRGGWAMVTCRASW